MTRSPVLARRPLRLIAVAAAAMLALALVLGAAFMGARLATAEADAAAPSAAASAAAAEDAEEPTVADVYALVAPSVVVVETGESTGSGVVVNADGSIMTALHVVDGASSITVTFSDGTQASASVASTDESQDLATLTPDALPEVVVPATLGGGLDVGDAVLAIGTPLGLAWSASSGIVSGLDRTFDADGTELAGLIQFDAAVNPGSSGGPLVDSDGTVVGIVVALLTTGDDDTFAGVGLAVPIQSALAGSGEDGEPGDGGPQQ
ncbi:trypsin-like peptidase domain-containing protein [Demequina sp. SYSU T00039]|uniref:Trypsin-like peptidase domain-containing protein n=1 Tax=Demequina lignilytica TaxID=3051663 RepID=A0AAW7M778_9MICO|nr:MULTISPECIES: trypsin-like peptidase domain-containing protein [unclassified Demequina]MDN4486615.1 trypsin-like peptidase domain-containing protein [Demequina sp. SYSU T00039]MDN4489301.1 trypsin-like peptidase domain-containing protein [Demequina sp. SYSU T00068]